MAKILFIIAPKNFRDEELLEPIKALQTNNTISICSFIKGQCTGSLGAMIAADITPKEALARITEYHAVIFVGGTGSSIYHNDAVAHEIARKAAANPKQVLAAICWAVVTLAKAGVLAGKQMTGWVSPTGEEKKIFTAGKAKFQDKDVVVDGHIVTANGPHAAHEFGMEIKKLLESL
ncbi:DJ-1/PfpI family protein [Candidatus Woesearchaeota archaeon]|nr:DJ-1/PfpI family protein [Candidatus Woesearchaeota archaeon]